MGLYTKDNVYIADMHHHITMVLHQQTLWNYLLKKNDWEHANMENILWMDLSLILNSYTPIYKSRIMQLMHDWQQVGEQKQLMNETDIKCPMQCGESETRLHYLRCKDKAFCETRKKHLHLLHKQLESAGTYPGITTTIINLVTEGIVKQSVGNETVLSNTDRLMVEAATEQLQLGENSLVKGYLVKRWKDGQKSWESSPTFQQKLRCNGR